MGLTIQTPGGFFDVADSVLASGQPAFAIDLAKIYSNSVLGMVRPEVFPGVYKNGDTVALPKSSIDGYAYSRDELIYFWTVRNSTDPETLWITGDDSLQYGGWLVEQSTGIVHCDETYRRSGKHADITHTNDGKLEVWTVGQRSQAEMIVASSPTYADIDPAWLGVDKPFTQQLAQALSRNAKFALLNKEFFYLGEYYNGQTVVIPHSPVDGYAYSAAEATFIFSPRWTPPGNTSSLTPPDLSKGQLGPFMFSVNSSGVVSTTVKYIDDGGNLNSTNDGRIAVFAFFKRSGTPATLSAVADLFSEIDYDNFMPGDAVSSSLIDQIVENILQSLVEVERFGPTTHANGDTIALPTSGVDGYAYARDELSYFWTWSDTSNQTGSNLRLPLFFGHIDPATGVVTLHVWRLPPGGPYVDDDDALARISVVTFARRKTIAPTAWHAAEGSTPPTGSTTTGGGVVADVPTLTGATGEAAGGTKDSSNQTFTISTAGKIIFLVWNGQIRFDFTQTGTSTSFTTGFTPDAPDTLYAIYTT
jgi:hypothetical protein